LDQQAFVCFPGSDELPPMHRGGGYATLRPEEGAIE
jgi:hypothetical protein